MAARPKVPTILDIAAEAGVSKSAVSRALRGQGEVSPATREKVEAAARRLGYVANAMAQALVTSRTMNIGVVLRDVTRPYYAWLINGMQQEAEGRGYRVVTMTSAGELEVEDARRALATLVSLQVDGLVLASARLPSEDVVPFVGRMPIVVAGRREIGAGITSVFCDDADGGGSLADHLLDLGHRDIAVLLVDRDYSLSQHARTAAMVERIEASGATAHVWPVPDDNHTLDALTERFDGSGVTALMCPTDTAALDALEFLRRADIAVPDACSVTGFDGLGQIANPYIGLTTFRQPAAEIGRSAVELLIDKIERGRAQDRLVELRGEMVLGRTSGPPPA